MEEQRNNPNGDGAAEGPREPKFQITHLELRILEDVYACKNNFTRSCLMFFYLFYEANASVIQLMFSFTFLFPWSIRRMIDLNACVEFEIYMYV